MSVEVANDCQSSCSRCRSGRRN